MLSNEKTNARIPDELTASFNEPKTKRKLMALYGDSNTIYAGENALGEKVLVSISQNKIVTQTFQGNGWIREVTSDEQGMFESESYSRWCEIGARVHA